MAKEPVPRVSIYTRTTSANSKSIKKLAKASKMKVNPYMERLVEKAIKEQILFS